MDGGKMKTTFQLFIDNEQQIKKAFKWENHLVQKFAALQFTLNNQTADTTKLKTIVDYMKRQTSAFSYFRSNQLLIASKISLHSNTSVLEDTLNYYERLKQHGFKRSQYLPYVAYFLASEVSSSNINNVIERALFFYQKMKEEHYWLTSDEDYVLAMILAHYHTDVLAAISNAEQCYQYLNKHGMYKGNALQSISHLLTLSPEPVIEKCERLLLIEQSLKNKKIVLQTFTRPLLALLALLRVDTNTLVNQIVETEEMLQNVKGFRNFSLSKNNRLLFCISLVSTHYMQNEVQMLNATLQNSIQSIILAEQISMISVITAVSVSSSSSTGAD